MSWPSCRRDRPQPPHAVRKPGSRPSWHAGRGGGSRSRLAAKTASSAASAAQPLIDAGWTARCARPQRTVWPAGGAAQVAMRSAGRWVGPVLPESPPAQVSQGLSFSCRNIMVRELVTARQSATAPTSLLALAHLECSPQPRSIRSRSVAMRSASRASGEDTTRAPSSAAATPFSASTKATRSGVNPPSGRQQPLRRRSTAGDRLRARRGLG